MKKLFSLASLQKSFRGLAQAFLVVLLAGTFLCVDDLAAPRAAAAYPFWAQQNYETPREATGRIVCANCHLAAKPIKVEVPQSVLPDTVFKAVVEVPYDTEIQQVLGDGSTGGLNVGAVLMLPDGFKLAPEDRIPAELKEESEGLYFQEYSEDAKNILLVGPLPGDEHQEIVFPILSPNPATDKEVYFGKYSVHAGGNRGRGQVYPTGQSSNNAVFKATAAGVISGITAGDEGVDVTIATDSGESVVETVPPGPELIVAAGDTVSVGTPLTSDPNVGGFGQMDTEIVLQSSQRLAGLLAFFAAVMLAQIMLVLKKKQVEKVQAAEMNF